jgi:hypothetical protein
VAPAGYAQAPAEVNKAAPAKNMRSAGAEQQTAPAGNVPVAPAGNNQIEVAPAGNAHRAGKEPDRAGALCPSSAGGEQPDRPAATETDETTALLIRARSYIARGWCRGAMAKNPVGNVVDPTDAHASAWCAWGALTVAGISDIHGIAANLLATAIGRYYSISRFNDAQETVEPVLAAFDRAIAMSGQAG